MLQVYFKYNVDSLKKKLKILPRGLNYFIHIDYILECYNVESLRNQRLRDSFLTYKKLEMSCLIENLKP